MYKLLGNILYIFADWIIRTLQDVGSGLIELLLFKNKIGLAPNAETQHMKIAPWIMTESLRTLHSNKSTHTKSVSVAHIRVVQLNLHFSLYIFFSIQTGHVWN